MNTRSAHPVRVLAILILFVGIMVSASSTRSSLHAQSPTYGLPDLHSVHIEPEFFDEFRQASASPMRIASQEGIGGTVIDVLDRSGAANPWTLTLRSKTDGALTEIMRGLLPDGRARIALSDETAAKRGTYTGALRAEGAFEARARTTWPNQASAAYAAEEASRDLIVPLLVVNQRDHGTIFSVFNPSESETASVTLFIFNPINGEMLSTFQALIDPGTVSSWDTFFDQTVFGPSTLPPNAAGGFVGSIFIESTDPVVGLAYGEQLSAVGSSAYGARPKDAADTTQILPSVRADADGDTLLAITSAELGSSSTDVTISFVPEDGLAGSVEPIDMALTLSPRGAAFLDLGGRGRGTVDAPTLPAGFRGSAIITASRPVLAVALETHRQDDTIVGVAAYNAFAPAGLSAAYEVPTLRKQTDYRSSTLFLHNPATESASVAVHFEDADGAPIAQESVDLAPGALRRLGLTDLADVPQGMISARIEANHAISALVGEERDRSAEYPLPPSVFGLGPDRGSDVSGTAVITQVGDDIEVVVDLDSDSSLTLSIIEGPCSDDDARRKHSLSASARRSTTTLRNVSLLDLAETPHGIRGWRGRFRRVCGNIPVVFDVDDADASLVRALPARYTAPTPPPAASPTSEIPPTVEPSATPDAPPVPTSDPGGNDSTDIYLPLARHDAP